MGRQYGDAAQNQKKIIGVEERTDASGFVRNTHPGAQWFGNAGLGLFLHWGISGIHGGIDLSWGMMAGTPWDEEENGKNKLTPREYFALAEQFDPQSYDPYKWLKAAKDAGFQYAVLTTRHHDGYAMWPSKYGEFNTGKYLEGRDLVKPFVAACRVYGLKVGLYYSPPDWYVNRYRMSFGYGSGGTPEKPHLGIDHEPVDIPGLSGSGNSPNGFAASEYERNAFKSYIKGQVEELLTEYGPIDLLWFDGGPEAISIERIRELQPWIVVNPRMHGYGDFSTPECRMPEKPVEGWWEFCEIWMEGNAWGYSSSEKYRSTAWMLSRFCQVRSWGGNYLINAGPRPDGQLPEAFYQRLLELSDWMKHSSEAVLGVSPGPLPSPANVPVTVKEKTWYLHVLSGFHEKIEIKGTKRPVSVRLLRTKAKLAFTFEENTFQCEIPGNLRTQLVDIVEVKWI